MNIGLKLAEMVLQREAKKQADAARLQEMFDTTCFDCKYRKDNWCSWDSCAVKATSKACNHKESSYQVVKNLFEM
jgi:hypothetical protein